MSHSRKCLNLCTTHRSHVSKKDTSSTHAWPTAPRKLISWLSSNASVDRTSFPPMKDAMRATANMALPTVSRYPSLRSRPFGPLHAVPVLPSLSVRTSIRQMISNSRQPLLWELTNSPTTLPSAITGQGSRPLV